MSNDKIIPFGKYKGQEIEIVRQRDPQYLQWLMQQAWFAEKFQPVYQIVVNNFAPPSEDTPAHNALQVRFLEYDFRCAFWNAAGIKVEWLHLKQRWQSNTAHLRKAPQPFQYRREVRNNPREWMLAMFERHRDRVRNHWMSWRTAHGEPVCCLSVNNPKFETAFDVEFTVVPRVYDYDEHLSHSDIWSSYRLTIEIKPSMGDDYPAVLRQMKRQMSADRPPDGADYIHRFLLVDQFAAQAVTLDQVRKIFALDGFKVMLVAEVREQLIQLKRGLNG